MFANPEKKRLSGRAVGIPAFNKMEVRTAGPAVPTSEEHSARDARSYTKRRHRAASIPPTKRIES